MSKASQRKQAKQTTNSQAKMPQASHIISQSSHSAPAISAPKTPKTVSNRPILQQRAARKR